MTRTRDVVLVPVAKLSWATKQVAELGIYRQYRPGVIAAASTPHGDYEVAKSKHPSPLVACWFYPRSGGRPKLLGESAWGEVERLKRQAQAYLEGLLSEAGHEPSDTRANVRT